MRIRETRSNWRLRTIILALAVTFGACGDGGSENQEQRNEAQASTTTGRATTTSKVRDTTTSGAADTTRPTVAERPTGALDGFSECIDSLEDGTGGGDLTLTRLVAQTDVLSVHFETATPVTGETVLYSVIVDGFRYQIGLKTVGSEVFRFVFDFGTSQQENLTSAFFIDGVAAGIVVPLTALPGLTAPFDYVAVLNVNGQDVDSCDGTFSSG